jgi:SAM-dependent methyltransferase
MSQSVQAFYNGNVDREWQRLDTPLYRVEFVSTLRLITKYFPPSGRVCDIGSGPGRYALELARRGYQVTLFDLLEKCLERAQVAFEACGLSEVDGPMVFLGGGKEDGLGEETAWLVRVCEPHLVPYDRCSRVGPYGRREVCRLKRRD